LFFPYFIFCKRKKEKQKNHWKTKRKKHRSSDAEVCPGQSPGAALKPGSVRYLPSSAVLLRSQRHDRIQHSCLPGRHDAEEDADGYGYAEGQNEGPGGQDQGDRNEFRSQADGQQAFFTSTGL
jgi:hypothetical protein